MDKTKISNRLKLSRGRVIALIILFLAIIALLIFKFPYKNEIKSLSENKADSVSVLSNKIKNDSSLKFIDYSIDTILYSFGIKKEWITTEYNTGSSNKTTNVKDVLPKKSATGVLLFNKTVLIPKNLSSVEVNLDISDYLNSSGLKYTVNEDIITKNISVLIHNLSDTASSSMPLAKIMINHSDKAVRETGTFILILNNTGKYKKDEIDNILNTTYEFSFVFPRNLDDIDLQNKLVQQKKDVVINLTAGGKSQPDADFNSAGDEREVKQKVKSFISDFPGISVVVLSKTDQSVSQSFIQQIAREFNYFKIKVINDSLITPLLNKNEEDSKDKVSIILNNMKAKGSQTNREFISIVSLSYSEFQKFYSGLSALKKLGYKFYSLSDYFNKEAEKQKQELHKDEKTKEDKDKSSGTTVNPPSIQKEKIRTDGKK